MAFIALKPCSFGGKSFRIGDQVPHELVLPEMKRRLISMGFLVEVFTAQSEPESAPSAEEDSPLPEPESAPPAEEDGASLEPEEKPKRPRAKAAKTGDA